MAIDYAALMALDIPERACSYDEPETMLYALGVGFGTDPVDSRELGFVHEASLQAVPTMATVIGWDRSWIPRTGIRWPLVVHGDQTLRIHRPVPAVGRVVTSARVTEILDKGRDKGALFRIETRARDAATNEPLWTTSSGFFARGDGGFRDEIDKGPVFHRVPGRAPDLVRQVPTHPAQALLYRLSGDRNPLHALPSASEVAGFPRPVLHGLCTYGFACRSVLLSYCDGDASRVRAFDARFSSPLFPGETLGVEMWRDDDLVSFRVRCIERDKIVLDNGRALLA